MCNFCSIANWALNFRCPHNRRFDLDSPPISTSFGAKLTISDQTIYFCSSGFERASVNINQQHDNIWQSNVPRFVSRCSCLVFHEMGWSSIACSKRLLVTRSWDCLHHPPSPNDSSCVRPNVPPVTPVDLEYVFHLSVALHRVRCARSRSTNVSVVRDGSNSSEML